MGFFVPTSIELRKASNKGSWTWPIPSTTSTKYAKRRERKEEE
jgi:hypothetical protein